MQRTATAPTAPSPAIPRAAVSAALCAGLMAATAWAVLAAGWAQGAGGAVVVAVAAALEAALLARAAVPRLVAAALAPPLALAAIVPTTLRAMPFDGNTAAGHVVQRYVGAIFGGLGASSDWEFTVGLCAILWLCGYWLGWLAMREGRGILGVLPIYAVLATNVLNTHSPDNVALPEAIAVCFSLLVVADTHLDALLSRAARRRVASLPGTRTRFALSVAVMSVVLTLAALLIPPISSTDISSRFFPGPQAPGGTGAGSGSDGKATIAFNAATQPDGALVSRPRPVLTYSVDTTVPVYLRVSNDTQFANGNWYPDHPGDSFGQISWEGIPYTGGDLPRDGASGDGALPAAVTEVHATITLQADPSDGTSFAPIGGEPVAIDQAGIAYGGNAVDGNGLLTVDSVQIYNGTNAGTTLHTTGWISKATAAQLRAAGTQYPGFVRQYLALPDDATHGVAVISRLAHLWTAGTTNPYDEATAIETRLRDPAFYQYTLTPPAAPTNQWPIVFFLTSSHRGYCQYFAASMGAMLRALGIPTRLVNGYGPGTSQQESVHPGVAIQQTVTTSDAHTWVEAYFPRYGWIPFEPTPPSSDGNYFPFSRGSHSGGVPTGQVPQPTPGAGHGSGGAPKTTSTGTTGGGAHVSAALLAFGAAAGAVAAATLLFVLWLMIPATLPGAWRRLEALGAAAGMPRRPAETYSDYAARFVMSRKAGDVLRSIATLRGRAEFSRDGIARVGVRQTLALWFVVLMAAPRFAWRRRRRSVPAPQW